MVWGGKRDLHAGLQRAGGGKKNHICNNMCSKISVVIMWADGKELCGKTGKSRCGKKKLSSPPLRDIFRRGEGGLSGCCRANVLLMCC